MEEFLRLAGYALGTIAALGGIALLFYGGELVEAWRKVRQSKSEAALKRAMIERGMSADDIVRVLQAGSECDPASRDTTNRGGSPGRQAVTH